MAVAGDRVLAIDTEACVEVITLSAGARSGFVNGTLVEVIRGGEIVAELIVIASDANHSVALITALFQDRPVNIGQTVQLKAIFNF